jgi:hypothetical protein
MLLQRNLEVGEWTTFQISPSLTFLHKLGGHTNWLGGLLQFKSATYGRCCPLLDISFLLSLGKTIKKYLKHNHFRTQLLVPYQILICKFFPPHEWGVFIWRLRIVHFAIYISLWWWKMPCVTCVTSILVGGYNCWVIGWGCGFSYHFITTSWGYFGKLTCICN